MAFSCLGYRVSQQTIVKTAWGDIRNAPANPIDIVNTVRREYVDSWSGRFRPKADLYARFFSRYIEMAALPATFAHVAAGKPAILMTEASDGASGHATMLTHLSVRRPTGRNTGDPELSFARVFDPWPGIESRVLTRDDWRRSLCIVLIDI